MLSHLIDFDFRTCRLLNFQENFCISGLNQTGQLNDNLYSLNIKTIKINKQGVHSYLCYFTSCRSFVLLIIVKKGNRYCFLLTLSSFYLYQSGRPLSQSLKPCRDMLKFCIHYSGIRHVAETDRTI